MLVVLNTSVKKFKDNYAKSGITITFSLPYHHQASSLAKRAIGTCKSLWKKAVASSQCLQIKLWYRVTLIDNHLPSPYISYSMITNQRL